MLSAENRRREVYSMLEKSTKALSASLLAKEFGVSRQIIVGDIAILRAEGRAITATHRGYVLEKNEMDFPYIGNIACKHSKIGLEDELNIVTDFGGTIIDVTVDHPIYGQLSGMLKITTKDDVREFLSFMERGDVIPLSILSEGVHTHKIGCASEKIFDLICGALQEKDILLEK